MRKLIIVALLLFAQCRAANEITIINETTEPVYIGLYYAKTNILGMGIGPASRASQIMAIEPAQKIQITRPRAQSRTRRELIFSTSYYELLPLINSQQYQESSRIGIELFHEKVYHIAFCDKKLCGYDEISWRMLKPIKDFFKSISSDIAEKLKKKFLKHPYGSATASVRVGKHISRHEVDAVAKRAERAHPVIENFIGETMPDILMPRILVCLSGGGDRIGICAAGLFAGLEDIGLLDGVLYVAALSGSTWFLAHYLTLGLKINEYQEQLIKSLSRLHMLSPSVIVDALSKKLAFGQDINLVDLYGIFLANSWFRNINNDADRQKVVLSNLVKRVENGEWPFPLFTAIETTFDYNWFVFTPYEIGSESTGIYIPSWAFGRKFDNGKSIDFAPEPSLGYLMGIWGSALSGSGGDMLQRLGFASLMPGAIGKIIRELIFSTKLQKASFSAATIFNIAKGMQCVYKNKEKMIFVDAGYDSYLPIPPALNKDRAIDIIIILDATMGIYEGSTSPLHDAQVFAETHHLNFPPIDYTNLTKRFISVFDNKNDPRCPTVIYMVPVKNEKFNTTFDPAKSLDTTYATSKFVFTKAQIEKLSGLVRKSVVDSKEKLIQAIKEKVRIKKEAAKAA